MKSAVLLGLVLTSKAYLFASADSSGKQQSTNEGCQAPDPSKGPNPRPLGNYTYWGMTTDAHECKNVTRKIIYNKNGSIVDAAIATLLCMGVALPHRMGLGGGFIATVYNQSSREAQVLIARESAPLCAYQDMFTRNPNESLVGGKSVAVPGELRGYHELHKRYGKLNWSDLFDDAINLAQYGFPIQEDLASALKAANNQTFALANKTSWQVFVNNKTKGVLQKGDKLIQSDLAETLKAIAANGSDYFYNGSFAEDLVREVVDNGGVMIASDLTNYSASWVTPLNRTFKGNLTLYTAPPPGSGGVVAYILGIMDAFRETKEECLPENVTTLHRFAESCKFGYAKRAALGDRQFVDCEQVLTEMTSTEKAEEAKSKINDTRTFGNLEYYGYTNGIARHDEGNAHATFWYRDDIVIAVSSTINHPFGSWIRTNSGVILNNQMNSFSTPSETGSNGKDPSYANYIAPRKRPMSSMAPTVVVGSDGKAVLAVGGTGGSLLASGIALVTTRVLWQCSMINDAIDKPRLHNQLVPSDLMVEPFFPEDNITALQNLGHNVTKRCGMFNIVSGVQQKEGRIYPYSDPRNPEVEDSK